MPKEGTRTFNALLRAFGIGGEDGRRLRFALGNDISPVVDADAYDPWPTFLATTLAFAVVGERCIVDLSAPADRGILVRQLVLTGATDMHVTVQWTESPVNGGAGYIQNVLGLVSGSGVAPLSGMQFGTIVQVGQRDPAVVYGRGAGGESVWFPQPFALGAGRRLIINPSTDNTAITGYVMWSEPRVPPPS